MNKHSLIGSYQLVSWENRHLSGKLSYPMGHDAVGFLNYSQDSYMFVHIMANNRKPHAQNEVFSGSCDELIRSAATYLSYCGRFELQGNEIIHHIEVCSFPNWSGTAQRRVFRFNDGRLYLSALGIPFEHETVDAHLAWRRVPG